MSRAAGAFGRAAARPLRWTISPRAARGLLLATLGGVAVVGAAFTGTQLGRGGDLVARQRAATGGLTAAAVERVVRLAPDPRTRTPGRSASCVRSPRSALGNPWRCTIAYAHRSITYTVTLAPSGRYTGDHEQIHSDGSTRLDTGVINGCCVAIP